MQFTKDNGINYWLTPDMNPIENLRHELKNVLRTVVKPKNKEEYYWSLVYKLFGTQFPQKNAGGI